MWICTCILIYCTDPTNIQGFKPLSCQVGWWCEKLRSFRAKNSSLAAVRVSWAGMNQQKPQRHGAKTMEDCTFSNDSMTVYCNIVSP